ncbi:hypothetical protein BKA69DRAFT_1051229 [Paraphysoderma sedebokerense]|nr:hypothetical protein BKA69DRAFT_1051229 [Paraphysoderma sedebokerense]
MPFSGSSTPLSGLTQPSPSVFSKKTAPKFLSSPAFNFQRDNFQLSANGNLQSCKGSATSASLKLGDLDEDSRFINENDQFDLTLEDRNMNGIHDTLDAINQRFLNDQLDDSMVELADLNLGELYQNAVQSADIERGPSPEMLLDDIMSPPFENFKGLREKGAMSTTGSVVIEDQVSRSKDLETPGSKDDHWILDDLMSTAGTGNNAFLDNGDGIEIADLSGASLHDDASILQNAPVNKEPVFPSPGVFFGMKSGALGDIAGELPSKHRPRFYTPSTKEDGSVFTPGTGTFSSGTKLSSKKPILIDKPPMYPIAPTPGSSTPLPLVNQRIANQLSVTTEKITMVRMEESNTKEDYTFKTVLTMTNLGDIEFDFEFIWPAFRFSVNPSHGDLKPFSSCEVEITLGPDHHITDSNACRNTQMMVLSNGLLLKVIHVDIVKKRKSIAPSPFVPRFQSTPHETQRIRSFSFLHSTSDSLPITPVLPETNQKDKLIHTTTQVRDPSAESRPSLHISPIKSATTEAEYFSLNSASDRIKKFSANSPAYCPKEPAVDSITTFDRVDSGHGELPTSSHPPGDFKDTSVTTLTIPFAKSKTNLKGVPTKLSFRPTRIQREQTAVISIVNTSKRAHSFKLTSLGRPVFSKSLDISPTTSPGKKKTRKNTELGFGNHLTADTFKWNTMAGMVRPGDEVRVVCRFRPVFEGKCKQIWQITSGGTSTKLELSGVAIGGNMPKSKVRATSQSAKVPENAQLKGKETLNGGSTNGISTLLSPSAGLDSQDPTTTDSPKLTFESPLPAKTVKASNDTQQFTIETQKVSMSSATSHNPSNSSNLSTQSQLPASFIPKPSPNSRFKRLQNEMQSKNFASPSTFLLMGSPASSLIKAPSSSPSLASESNGITTEIQSHKNLLEGTSTVQRKSRTHKVKLKADIRRSLDRTFDFDDLSMLSLLGIGTQTDPVRGDGGKNQTEQFAQKKDPGHCGSSDGMRTLENCII